MNADSIPSLASSLDWLSFNIDKTILRSLETEVLPDYVNTCRWFAGKARRQRHIRISVVHPVPMADTRAYLVILDVFYDDNDTESYLLPLSFVPGKITDIPAKGILAQARFGETEGWLVDAIYDERFRLTLFQNLGNQVELPQENGQLCFNRGRGMAAGDFGATVRNRVLPVDSSNSALVFTGANPQEGEKYFLKLYRKLFQETNPEVEVVSFLTEHSSFDHIPAYAGSLVWQREGADQPDITLGMMQRMVENDKDSWALTGDYLNEFLYAVPNRLFSVKEDVFDMVELLGKRTGEMHCALYKPQLKTSDGTLGSAFAPEPFTNEYREFIIRRFENLLERRYNLLIDNYLKLDPQAQRLAWVFMEAKEMIDEFVQDFRTRPLESLRIRIHGDYHLGQVLAVKSPQYANDFVIIDFEGEPEISIADRKIKHSPLKDVAGMIRSYHYAVCAKLFNSNETKGIDSVQLQRVSDRWFRLMRETYMDAYLDTFGQHHPLLRSNTEINFLLLVYLLEKAVYELGYEISYRPAWVNIPLTGIVDVIREIEKIRAGDPGRKLEIPPLQTGLLQTKS